MLPPSFLRTKRASSRTQRLWNRALLFAGALLVLWALVQFIPAPDFGDQPPVHSDEAGTVAARPETLGHDAAPSVLTPGRIAALLLLAGGVVLAVVLHRRHADGTTRAGTVPIEPLGTYTIAPNQDLRLVACGGEVLLLGVTPQQITLLKTYPRDQFDVPSSGDGAAAPQAAPPVFADLLRQYAGGPASS